MVGSRDRYRLGKSLRKQGFEATALIDGLAGIMDEVNQRLASWIRADALVTVEADGVRLTDRRMWRCSFLPGGAAGVPCGGTHVTRLGEILGMRAVASFDDQTGLLEIVNRVDVLDVQLTPVEDCPLQFTYDAVIVFDRRAIIGS